jgi:hypothetical protein
MWAKADACFDVVVPAAGPAGGALGLVRRTGYRIVAAASRDLRLLEELVIETDRVNRRHLARRRELSFATTAPRPRDTDAGYGHGSAGALDVASCYLRG